MLLKKYKGLLIIVLLMLNLGCLDNKYHANAGKNNQSEEDPQLATEAFELVNIERINRGIPPLIRNKDLEKVARKHTLDLINMEKLSHVSSNGNKIEDRLKKIEWIWAGENLARNKGYEDPAEEAVRGWIKSPMHAKNMFRNDFRDTGMVAIKDKKTGYVYFTQVFITPVN